MSRLVLASASPRRRELLAMLALPFEVQPADIDESPRPGEAPFNYVKRLAEEKAAAIAAGQSEGWVLAADTIVVLMGELMGKPGDEAEAVAMLQALRGRDHRVLTGVTVQAAATGKVVSDVCESKVRLRAMDDDEIAAYVATGDPMDKAAAYAIQNEEYAPVERVVGCPANVMGLPLCHVARSLRRIGVPLPPTDPLACRIQYGYYCAIAERVMPGLDEQGVLSPRE